MRAVAERLVGRVPAPAEGDGVAGEGELLAFRVDQVDRALHEVRAVHAGRDARLFHVTPPWHGPEGPRGRFGHESHRTGWRISTPPVNWMVGARVEVPGDGDDRRRSAKQGAEPPDGRAPGHEPRGVEPRRQQDDRGSEGERGREPVHDGGAPQLPGDRRHQRHRGGIRAVEERAGPGGPPEPRDERARERHEHEGRQEDRHGCHDRARHPGHEVADEGRGGENGPGRELADRDGVEQLRVGEPAGPLDQVRPEERQEDVAAPEEDRADLEEDEGELREDGARARRRAGERGEPGRARERRGRGALPGDQRPGASGPHHAAEQGQAERRREQEHDLVGAPKGEDEDRQRDGGGERGGDGLPGEAPHRLDHDGDDHRLDAVEDPPGLGKTSVAGVRDRQAERDQHRRQDEARAARDEARPARAHEPDVDRHLRRVRTGDEVGRAEEVEELRRA